MSHVIEDFALLTARARKAKLVLKPTHVGGRESREMKRKRNSEHGGPGAIIYSTLWKKQRFLPPIP